MTELYPCALGSLRHCCGCENGYKLQVFRENEFMLVQSAMQAITSSAGSALSTRSSHKFIIKSWQYLFHSCLEFVVFSVYCLFPDVMVSNCIFVAVASLCRSLCVIHRKIQLHHSAFWK